MAWRQDSMKFIHSSGTEQASANNNDTNPILLYDIIRHTVVM